MIKQKQFISFFIIIYIVAFVIVLAFKNTCIDFLSYIPNFICREIIRLLLIIPYCAMVIPTIFNSILGSKNVENRYYLVINFIFILLPVVLILQSTYLKEIF